MRRQLLAVLCLALLAGCIGLGGVLDDGDDGPDQHRIAVENGYADAQNVTVEVYAEDGNVTLLEETNQLTSGEQWIVTTLNGSEVPGESFTAAVSTDAHGPVVEHTGPVGGQGATVLVIGAGGAEICFGNVTCYE